MTTTPETLTETVKRIVASAENATPYGKAKQDRELGSHPGANTPEAKARYAFQMAQNLGPLAVRLAIRAELFGKHVEQLQGEVRQLMRDVAQLKSAKQ